MDGHLVSATWLRAGRLHDTEWTSMGTTRAFFGQGVSQPAGVLTHTHNLCDTHNLYDTHVDKYSPSLLYRGGNRLGEGQDLAPCGLVQLGFDTDIGAPSWFRAGSLETETEMDSPAND